MHGKQKIGTQHPVKMLMNMIKKHVFSRSCTPCVHQKRTVSAWCRHTRGRFECAHGGVFKRVTPHHTTHHTHRKTPQQHDHNTTRRQRETEKEDKRRHDKTKERKTRQDKTRQDKTRRDETRRDETRRDKTRGERREKRQETRDKRQETRDKRQETRDEREDERQDERRDQKIMGSREDGAELIVLRRGINLTIQRLNCRFSKIIN